MHVSQGTQYTGTKQNHSTEKLFCDVQFVSHGIGILKIPDQHCMHVCNFLSDFNKLKFTVEVKKYYLMGTLHDRKKHVVDYSFCMFTHCFLHVHL